MLLVSVGKSESDRAELELSSHPHNRLPYYMFRIIVFQMYLARNWLKIHDDSRLPLCKLTVMRIRRNEKTGKIFHFPVALTGLLVGVSLA